LPNADGGSCNTLATTIQSSPSQTTSASTPAGSYSLTITGISGSLTHTATVSLVVSAPTDFTLSGSPASQTVTQGGATSYGVTIKIGRASCREGGEIVRGASGCAGGS